MKSYIFKIILSIVVATSLISCHETLYTISNIYIENPTDKEYLVCLDKKNYHKDETNIFIVVLPNTAQQIIDTHMSVNDITGYYGGVGDYYVWIFDKEDSTYVKINDNELLIGPCVYGRFEDDYSEKKNNIVTNNAYYTINDSLLVKMTKNTQLTDSIFGLKK